MKRFNIFKRKQETPEDLIGDLIDKWYNNYLRYNHRYNDYNIIKKLKIDEKYISYKTRNITRKLNIARKLETEKYIKTESEILNELYNEILKRVV